MWTRGTHVYALNNSTTYLGIVMGFCEGETAWRDGIFPTGTLVKWHYKCRPLSPSFLFLSVDLLKSTSSSACAQRYLGPLRVHLVSRVLPSRTSWISLASSVSYMSRASARFLCSLAWDFSRALARSYDSWREQEKRCQWTWTKCNFLFKEQELS